MRHLNPIESRVLACVTEHPAITADTIAAVIKEPIYSVQSALGALQRGGAAEPARYAYGARRRWVATEEGRRHVA